MWTYFGGDFVHPTTGPVLTPDHKRSVNLARWTRGWRAQARPPEKTLVLERGHWGLGTIHLWIA